MEETLAQLDNTEFYTTLDLRSGYHQISLDESSKPLTAFITHNGLYEFNTLPFGLHAAPASFQRLMQNTFKELIGTCLLIYLDDLIIYSKTFNEHIEHLKQIFKILEVNGFQLHPGKCHFAQKEINYLGHTISAQGISPDMSKIEAVQNFPVPKTKTELRSFLGLANYYRNFIEYYSHISRPLHSLTSKTTEFNWTPVAQKSFEILKTKLTTAPILAHSNFKVEFYLFTDASDQALGVALCQLINQVEKVIAYDGRALTPPERSYTVTERELLAVVWSIKRFRPYIFGSHFFIVTDHSAIKQLVSQKDPKGRIARWVLTLQDHQFTVIHRAGTKHSNADALSRRSYPMIAMMSEPTLDSKQLHKMQLSDPKIYPILTFMTKGTLPTDDDHARRVLLSHDQYTLDENEILFKVPTTLPGKTRPTDRQLVVPQSLTHELLTWAHDSPFGAILELLKHILNCAANTTG